MADAQEKAKAEKLAAAKKRVEQMKKKSSGKKESKQEVPRDSVEPKKNAESLSKQDESTLQEQECHSLETGEPKQVSPIPYHDNNLTEASSNTQDHLSSETPPISGALDNSSSHGDITDPVNEKILPSDESQPITVSQEIQKDCEENHNQSTTGTPTKDSRNTPEGNERSTSDQGINDMGLPREQLQREIFTLHEKITTLNNEKIDYEAQIQTEKRQREIAERECIDLRTRLAQVEMENLQFVVEKERASQIHENAEINKETSEERDRLEKRVRDLEAEIYKLRGDAWKERRRSAARIKSNSITSPGAKFTEVDLGGELSPRRHIAQADKGGWGVYIE
ncbi:hypothetical protein BGHDH14_bgh06324 [Blumeria hordei DH14]|uniref:Uncharacterized protein n=1 Tax=Blumeria graminis f. sp. hordei (strain DH14) TaxID=546991 RepID=N1JAU1_BLUG1|nr:hypothetical protein BGHDH14_bgh06324 [Blumeria hordei DH14]